MAMSEKTTRIFNVLFLCTGNSARSILAESILRQDGAGRFRAFSAGSQPKGEVHPTALRVLENFHYPTGDLRSKSWDEFAGPNAPVMDFVFTVCDNAAGEVCPFWPGQPMTAHWGIEDPAAATGTALTQEMAFINALRQMKARIAAFTALPVASLDRASLATRLREIGQSAGATPQRPDAAQGQGMDVVIYHNPDCGTSRNTLGLIRNAGVEPHVVEYLKSPPSREMLVQLIARMGISARDLLREKGTPYADLGLGDPALTEDQLLDSMMAHPVLINRPLVISPKGVRLCRPSEMVLDLLPPQKGAFSKEDGQAVTGADGRPVTPAAS